MIRLMGKLTVGIVYGGRSGEHDVSRRSAASVFKKIDRTQFTPKPIYIDQKGKWHWANIPDSFAQSQEGSLPKADQDPEVVLLPRPEKQDGRAKGVFAFQDSKNFGKTETVDLILPMVHGTNCEDGSLQGLFDSAEIPYIGSGVLASALCMDKEVAKRLAHLAGIPIVPYFVSFSWDSKKTQEDLLARVEKEFGFPVFIKAAGQGSSLGVYKVKTREEFLPKLNECYEYDTKVLIEKAIDAREIEFSVLENSNRAEAPLVSEPAEIIPTHEFYTYEAKYHDDNGAVFKIPAEISAEQKAKLKPLVQSIFTTLECEGYARIDLFMDKHTGALYFNEVNSLPGFTSISMFPKLWEISGIAYTDLITRLINLALSRHARRSKIKRER